MFTVRARSAVINVIVVVSRNTPIDSDALTNGFVDHWRDSGSGQGQPKGKTMTIIIINYIMQQRMSKGTSTCIHVYDPGR